MDIELFVLEDDEELLKLIELQLPAIKKRDRYFIQSGGRTYEIKPVDSMEPMKPLGEHLMRDFLKSLKTVSPISKEIEEWMHKL